MLTLPRARAPSGNELRRLSVEISRAGRGDHAPGVRRVKFNDRGFGDGYDTARYGALARARLAST